MSAGDTIQVTVNGVLHTVGSDEAVNTVLVSFIRNTLGLTGTHVTCEQGGCGVCTVVATAPDPATGGTTTFSINSCLASLYNCDGWSITTIEGLGNREDGYHVIQERLADYYGTQCGYCSPGMVMNMHGLTQSNGSWTDADVEKNLDGHICRCTGFRPILDAFKSITPVDIEDSAILACSNKSTSGCCRNKATASSSEMAAECTTKMAAGCCKSQMAEGVTTSGCCKGAATTRAKKEITVDGVTFYSPTTTQELITALAGLPDGTSYQLMFGNTGIGFTGIPEVSAVFSLRNISELASVSVTTAEVTAGAAVSISTLKAAFKQAQQQAGFEYLGRVEEHWQKVGSTSVRNLGSWAGNLIMKVQNNFPSDIFMTTAACGAEVLVANNDGSTAWMSVESLAGQDLRANRQVLLRLRFVPFSLDTFYRSYKVMPRSINSAALVGAAFRLRVDTAAAYTVSETPFLVFESINDTFIHAINTETYLTGKSLLDVSVLQTALATLEAELLPDNHPADPDPQYRKDVAQSLLYKAIMSIVSESGTVDASILSGAEPLVRPLSSGTQTYDDNAATWPLGQPIPKLESKAQCSGEAKYINDEPFLPNELTGMFVQTTRANATIVSIDTSAALMVPGVVGFVSAADIPGVNDMQPFSEATVQPVFADGRSGYYGQAIGVLVGEVAALKKALPLVTVTYSDEKTPILTIADSLANGPPADEPAPLVVGDVAAGFAASTRIVEGSMNRDGQYHFHMESQVARVVPNEEDFQVFASTQWPNGSQAAIAQVLNIDANRINISVKRLGGGFGGKIIACNLVITAAALAAYKFRRPVRIALDLKTNMTMIGWRDPFVFNYKVGVDDTGLLKAVQATLIGDAGFVPVDSSAPGAVFCMPNCYACPNWEVTPLVVLTDTACNTWCRTPSTIEGITAMEIAMEHVANEIGMDPLEFRKMNLIPDGGSRMADTLPVRARIHMRSMGYRSVQGSRSITIERNLISDMITQIETEADVVARKAEIEQFNLDNRWRKRGLAVIPMLWPYEVPSIYPFGVFVSIYGADGTVAIAHGGIELGQGINTKVAQVAAYELGCSLDKIRIKPTDTLSSANSSVTGGSVGSDVNCYCVQKAAAALRARLDATATAGASWEETVRKAFNEGVCLSEYYWNAPDEVKPYAVYGVACTEVELDVLTGNFLVLRTDILEDAGISPSPLVDIGQVEGSWLHGQGLFTTEGPKYDPATGEKLTIDTWKYKPPLATDIPTDLRVTLLKDAPNPDGVLSSKVTNEPPVCLAFAVPLALRVAITSARADAGTTGWFQMDTPLSVDRIQQLCLVDPKQFSFSRTGDKKYGK